MNEYKKHIYPNIERLRIIASIGVVSFHAHEAFWRSFGVIGFIVLIIGFCCFVVNKDKPYSITKIAHSKFIRLIVPWLFWSAIYSTVLLLKVLITPKMFSDVFSFKMLLIGTKIHLWFLPFSFISAIILGLINLTVKSYSNHNIIVVSSILSVFSVITFATFQMLFDLPAPYRQWALGFPSLPIGYTIGRLLIEKDKNTISHGNYILLLLFSIILICSLLSSYLFYNQIITMYSLYVIRYFIAVLLFVFAINVSYKTDKTSKYLSSKTYGIYLIHPLIITILNNLGWFVDNPFLLLLCVLILSTLFTELFHRSMLKSFV